MGKSKSSKGGDFVLSKRKIITITSLLFLALVIGVIFIIMFTLVKQEKLLVNLPSISGINYNNYLLNNNVDYKEGHFAWLKSTIFGTKLTVLDRDGKYQHLNNIDAPFQINQKQIIFISNGNLQFKDLSTQKTTKIAKGVGSFISYQNYVIFCSANSWNNDSGKWENNLSIYDLSSKKTHPIYENLQQFYMHQNRLFVVNNEEWLVEISFSDYSSTKIIRLDIDIAPVFVMPQSENLLYLKGNKLIFTDIKTGNKKAVSIVDDEYINNRISFVCDDENVFVSFQATKTDGSIVSDINSENNGVWKINPHTMLKEKICDTFFKQIYLFGDELLLAVNNNDIYQIDTSAKTVIKINN